MSLNEPTDGAAAAEVPPALTLQQKLAAVVQLNTARTEMKRVKKLKKEFKKFVEVGDYRRYVHVHLVQLNIIGTGYSSLIYLKKKKLKK